jgi:hypothetical protein
LAKFTKPSTAAKVRTMTAATTTSAVCITASVTLAMFTDYDIWTLLLAGLAILAAMEGVRR